MNYTYTEAEKARIRQSCEQIRDYCLAEIVPLMQKYETIKIDFGGIYRCPRTGTPIEKYHFLITQEGKYCEDKCYYVLTATQFGSYDPIETSWLNTKMAVLENWKSLIKPRILAEIEKRKKVSSMIMNFEI